MNFNSLSKTLFLVVTATLVFCLASGTAQTPGEHGATAAHSTDKELLGTAGHDEATQGAESHGAAHGGGHHGVDGSMLPLFWALPFIGVLLSIALFPLTMEHFWHHNYGKVAAFWALLFAIPYWMHFGQAAIYEFLHIILLDYVPFIILLGTLFTVAGGICLKGSLRGSPLVNTIILIIGTSLASFMGTTGAAMLLIRPLIRANKWRKRKMHLIVFFIFLVANIGGSLTPLGDPPLFLGFLKGVSFGWTFRLFPIMLFASSILIVIFFIMDTILYKTEGAPPEDGEKQPLRLGKPGKRAYSALPFTSIF
ncbi:MAG: sodium:proton antiporter, partial [Planctomycetes bacterium]|nr:sodium:proton antiporter [Planctomycetota bacterium]